MHAGKFRAVGSILPLVRQVVKDCIVHLHDEVH